MIPPISSTRCRQWWRQQRPIPTHPRQTNLLPLPNQSLLAIYVTLVSITHTSRNLTSHFLEKINKFVFQNNDKRNKQLTCKWNSILWLDLLKRRRLRRRRLALRRDERLSRRVIQLVFSFCEHPVELLVSQLYKNKAINKWKKMKIKNEKENCLIKFRYKNEKKSSKTNKKYIKNKIKIRSGLSSSSQDSNLESSTSSSSQAAIFKIAIF